MKQHNEITVNARGLKNPGPRMMVETTLAGGRYKRMRVVVSSIDAMNDLLEYFSKLGASTETDQIGDDYHVFVDFPSDRTT